MSEAAKLLLEFALFALPYVPGLLRPFAAFWEAKGFGPLPPNLDAWREIDAKTEARMRATDPDLSQIASKR